MPSNQQGELEFISDQTLKEEVSNLKLLNLITTPIDLSIQVRGKYFRNGLTEGEFNKLLSDFIVFEDLWMESETEDYFHHISGLSRFTRDSISVDHEKLFYFFTKKIQSAQFRTKVLEEPIP